MAYLYLLVFSILGRNTLASPKLLDLSYTYNLDPRASHRVTVLEKSMNRINIGVELNQMCNSEHAGTHLQAPLTFHESGFSVDAIPYNRIWRVPGVLIDVSPFVYPEYKITADVLQQWEDEADLFIPDGSVLLIRTDFTPRRILPSHDSVEEEEEGPRPQPGLTEDAGEWLVNYRYRRELRKGIVGVGIDLDSLDENDTNATTSVRSILYRRDIYALHNLKNLDMLPRSGFLLTVMPMKIRRGTGAPARVLAEKVDTPPPQPEDEDEDERENGDWHVETDHIYPYPHWGISMASANLSRSCYLVMVFPVLTVLHFWLKGLV